MPYITVAELRAVGITEEQADDLRLAELIERAEASIEGWCGWWFEVREKTVRLDGNGKKWLDLPIPAVSVDSVRVDGIEVAGWVPYCEDEERFDPRLYWDYGWTQGRRNVEVVGMFGFVESDGSAPQLVRDACHLLVQRFLLPDGEWQRVSQESAEGAQMIYEKDYRFAGWSGDPEIDSRLAQYRRPLGVGVV